MRQALARRPKRKTTTIMTPPPVPPDLTYDATPPCPECDRPYTWLPPATPDGNGRYICGNPECPRQDGYVPDRHDPTDAYTPLPAARKHPPRWELAHPTPNIRTDYPDDLYLLDRGARTDIIFRTPKAQAYGRTIVDLLNRCADLARDAATVSPNTGPLQSDQP